MRKDINKHERNKIFIAISAFQNYPPEMNLLYFNRL